MVLSQKKINYCILFTERHKVNTQIEQLKVQNADLRRLLQKYALPNNVSNVNINPSFIQFIIS